MRSQDEFPNFRDGEVKGRTADDDRTFNLGSWGEWFVGCYLQAHGFGILDRNVSSGVGEIDLVVIKQGEIIFVEVKTRRGLGFGVSESVTRQKLARMRRAAGAWLASHPEIKYSSVRFDVITVLVSGDAAPEITHYEAVDRGAR